MVTPQGQADALLVEHLAWLERNWAKDQKRLKSILESWGY